MSTWMVISLIWAMFAMCVVLFVRGATARAEFPEEGRDDRCNTRADAPSRVKV